MTHLLPWLGLTGRLRLGEQLWFPLLGMGGHLLWVDKTVRSEYIECNRLNYLITIWFNYYTMLVIIRLELGFDKLKEVPHKTCKGNKNTKTLKKAGAHYFNPTRTCATYTHTPGKQRLCSQVWLSCRAREALENWCCPARPRRRVSSALYSFSSGHTHSGHWETHQTEEGQDPAEGRKD